MNKSKISNEKSVNFNLTSVLLLVLVLVLQ